MGGAASKTSSKLVEKAKILSESLPYIRKFYGKRFVIKYGGAAMVDEALKRSFCLDVILMKYIGIYPVIVHGGGPQIGQTMKKMGKEARFINGLRVTDDETLEIVEMVLGGKINKEIVGLINQHGGKAVGLSGKDGALILAEKLIMNRKGPEGDGQEMVDIGLVGKVKSIRPQIIEVLDQNGFIPVIAPLGVSEDGLTYNINADTVAGEIAAALKAEKLIFLSDIEGVFDEHGRLISSIAKKDIEEKVACGTIKEGMIPKLEACLKALEAGVGKVHIIDGRVLHALLLEIFTDKGVGTEIVVDTGR